MAGSFYLFLHDQPVNYCKVVQICLISNIMFFGVIFYYFYFSKSVICGQIQLLFLSGAMILSVINSVALWIHRNDSYYGHYFTLITLALNHLSLFVNVCASLHGKERIQKCMDDISEKFSLTSHSWKISALSFSSIIILWNVLSILQLLEEDTRLILASLLYLEKLGIALFETELCIILLYMKACLKEIITETEHEISIRKGHRQTFYHTDFSSFSSTRAPQISKICAHHISVYKFMLSVNTFCGPCNTILTLRERFSLVIYLYFWLKRGQSFDLIIGAANFFRTSMIFYCYQILKNEETRLKSAINLLAANYSSDALEKERLMYLHKQVEALNIKFDACGFFSMDLNTVIYILTSTAGYLLLLSQLDL